MVTSPNSIYRTGLTLGILGGGQLARMLAEAALRLGLRPLALAETSDSPVARGGARVKVGSMSDGVALDAFLSEAPLVIFENEWVDCDRLAEAAARYEVTFLPGLAALKTLRDKSVQKQILSELEIPTA